MHEMRTIATDDPVAWSVCLSVKRLRPAKTAKRIQVLFGVEALGSPGHNVLNGGTHGEKIGK